MRGKFRTDAEGRYLVRTVRPVHYPIPSDGPVGAMLRATGRHPWRPAHIHFVVSAEDYEPVTTHIFDSADEYLASDAVFAVKDSLICDFTHHDTAEGEARRLGIEPPYYTTEFDFHLKPASGEATVLDAQKRLAALGAHLRARQPCEALSIAFRVGRDRSWRKGCLKDRDKQGVPTFLRSCRRCGRCGGSSPTRCRMS